MINAIFELLMSNEFCELPWETKATKLVENEHLGQNV
jgi:hypothetical protein